MKGRSLRFRLTVAYAGLVAGLLLPLGFLSVWALSRHLCHDAAQGQLARAALIEQSLRAPETCRDEASLAAAIEARCDPAANSTFIRVSREDGKLLYVSAMPQDRSFDPRLVPPLTPRPKGEEVREQTLPGFAPLLIGARPFQAGEGPRLLIEAGASLAPLKARLARLRLQLALGLGGTAAVMVLGAALLLDRALKPLDRLADKAGHIANHNLLERLPVSPTHDELDRLSLALNRMLDRLEDAVLNAKRFGAEAAHELRTPLTVLRGELEHVLRDRRLPPDLQASLEKMLEELERLIGTVAKLFTLARLDLGETRAAWAPVDLAELAGSTVDHLLLLAAEKQISLSCDASHPVSVQGDRLRLKQVVVNLLDNAIKYTPPGGAVKLRVFADGNRARLEVADNGIGIPPEALPRIFERFYRLEPSQFQPTPRRAGLGLAIVAGICRAHGGEVTVESTPGSGTCFRVEFPLAGATGSSSARYSVPPAREEGLKTD